MLRNDFYRSEFEMIKSRMEFSVKSLFLRQTQSLCTTSMMERTRKTTTTTRRRGEKRRDEKWRERSHLISSSIHFAINLTNKRMYSWVCPVHCMWTATHRHHQQQQQQFQFEFDFNLKLVDVYTKHICYTNKYGATFLLSFFSIFMKAIKQSVNKNIHTDTHDFVFHLDIISFS